MIIRCVILDKLYPIDFSFLSEDTLFLTVTEEITPKNFLYLYRFCCSYSDKNKCKIFAYGFYASKPHYRTIIFENGEVRCVSGDSEEGEERKKVYKKVGVLCRNEWLCPYSYNLFAAGAEMVACQSTEPFLKEYFGTVHAIKNRHCGTFLLVFSDIVLVVDDSVRILRSGETLSIDTAGRKGCVPEAFLTINVIE